MKYQTLKNGTEQQKGDIRVSRNKWFTQITCSNGMTIYFSANDSSLKLSSDVRQIVDIRYGNVYRKTGEAR